MTTDTKVTELVLNELTEEKLKELEDAGTVPPNQVFLTDDDDERGSLPLGMIIPAAVVTDDARLHLLNGASLLQTGIHEQFCTWLKNRVLENSSNVPTCTITEYASEMATYGQCGKFVINNTASAQTSGNYKVEANSIKLPTITEFIASNNGGDSIGLAELDMFKSHVHNVGANNTYNYTTSGDNFAIGSVGYPIQPYNRSAAYTGGEETRPKNIRYPYYIVIATAVKTNIEVDIDNVANDINEINSILNKTEQVEVIYDMYDSSKDWGKSGGLSYDTTVSNKDFSKYKKLLLYARWGDNATGVGTLDLMHSFVTHGNTYQTNVSNKSISSPDPDTYWFIVSVSADKTTINIEKAGYDSFTERKICGQGTSLTAHIMRIEGVY